MAAELESRGYGRVDVAKGGLGEISVHWHESVLYHNKGLLHVPSSRRIVYRVERWIGWERPRPT